MDNGSGVYILQFANRLYVGSSRHMRRRVLRHLADLRRGNHCNEYLQRTFNKYGNPIYFAVLKCGEHELLRFEQLIIDIVKPCLNLSPTAGRNLGHKHSPETLRLMSEAAKKAWETRSRIQPDEVKERISRSTKGKVFSEETKRKIKLAVAGRTNSAETRQRISQSKRGKKINQKGHPMTPEILAKIAATRARNKESQ